VLHPAVVHDQQDDVRLGSTNLEPDAAPFDTHGGRSAPARSTVLAAYRETASILCAENESSLLHAGDDHYAVGLVEEILGDAFVVSMHHFGQRVGGGIQPVIDLDFSIGGESGATHGAGNCQNGY